MKTAEQWADEYLNHRTTYTDEDDLADKKKQRLVAFFERAIADARDEDLAALRADGWDTANEAAKARINEQEEEIARLRSSMYLEHIGLAWSREVEAWVARCKQTVDDILAHQGNLDVASGICQAVEMFYEQHGEKPPGWTQI